MEQYKNDLNGLTELLTAGVSPLHTIRHSMNLLESRGFTELSLDKAWALEPGKGYFVNAFDTTLIGFTVERTRRSTQASASPPPIQTGPA